MNETDGTGGVVSGAPNTILTSIYQCSPEFLSQLKLWIEQAGIAIPVNQLVGFSGFQAQQAAVNTSEGTTSLTYTDLATVGPSLTGLRPGSYVFLYGAQATGGASADTQWMALNIDGTAPSDSEAYIAAINGQIDQGAMVVTKTLANTNQNGATVKAQYRVSGGANTQFWNRRWLVALKYA